MKFALCLITSLIASTAYATGNPAPTPITNGPKAESVSEAHSSAVTSSDSQSEAKSYSDATAKATQTQTANGGASQAVNHGNNASQSTEFNYPRQAPSVGQGSISIAGCGAGGNAGGSNSHGAAFLGVAFTPADCKLLLAAAAYQALGMWDSACEMVNGISAVKARWKALGANPPSCAIKPDVPRETTPVVVNVAAATSPDLSNVATKEDLAGYVSKEEGRRIFERTVSK